MTYLMFTVWLVRRQIHRVNVDKEDKEEVKVLLTTTEGTTEIIKVSAVSSDTEKVLV